MITEPLDNERSGSWFDEIPGAPTIAELDCAAVLAQDLDAALAAIEPAPAPEQPWTPANPAPDWVRPNPNKRQPKRKRLWHEEAPNCCKCRSYAATGKIGPRAKRPEVWADLCYCQVKLLFMQHATARELPIMVDAWDLHHLFRFGKLKPEFADRCSWPRTGEPYPFEDPTEDDLDHVRWVIAMSRDEWLAEYERNTIKAETETQPKAPFPYVPYAYGHQGMDPNQVIQRHHTH